MAGASSHISKEMIELSFLECFQILMFLCYFFITTSSVFRFLFFFFFFFFKVQSKIGVRIIHRLALYTGKYGKHIKFLRKGKKKKSIFEFFINYEKTALQIFFFCFVRMFFGSYR